MIVRCTHCSTRLRFDESGHGGKTVQINCPKCQTKNGIKIPATPSVADSDKTVIRSGRRPDPNNVSVQYGKNGKIITGWLVVHTENTAVNTHEVYEGLNSIGRNPDADMTIPDDVYVSRIHCMVCVDKKNDWRYLVSDGTFLQNEKDANGSKNGTYINGKRLHLQDQIFLKDGDTLQVGRTKLVFKSIYQFKTSIDAAKDVSFLPYEKTIIR